VLAGTVVEIVSQKRFDVYMQGVVEQFSDGLKENATYNVARIKDYKNLGTIYVGSGGKWVPRIDNYTGTIPERNLTFYRIGTNGGVFGPQGGLRASVRHLNNYMYMYINKGVLKNGKRLLS
jgi:D-alanyl-D-alanine carboxypeptidase